MVSSPLSLSLKVVVGEKTAQPSDRSKFSLDSDLYQIFYMELIFSDTQEEGILIVLE